MSNWRAKRLLQARDDTSARSGPDATERDGRAALRFSPSLHPHDPRDSPFVIPCRSLRVVRVFLMLVWFEPREEVDEHGLRMLTIINTQAWKSVRK